GQPADGGRVDEELRARKRRQARGFGKPLIPADERAHLAVARLVRVEAEVARREVEFFVVERIVRNVHLAILARDAPVRVYDDGRVVIETGRALLKQRRDDDDLLLLGQLAQRLGRRAGDRLGQFEQSAVFGLAEVLRAEKLLQADDLRAALGRITNARQRLLH